LSQSNFNLFIDIIRKSFLGLPFDYKNKTFELKATIVSPYDFLRKITSRRKTEVKRDWRRSRIRLLFDKTGRAAIHGYKETFFLVTPNLSPFLDSDLTVEQMLVNGKTHEEAHQACVERYRYWFETSTDPFVKRYLLWDGANKFLKILGYAKH